GHGEVDSMRKRHADVYVFALLKHQDKASLDPLDLDQWEFYVLRSAVLDEYVPGKNRIALSSLLLLKPVKASFGEISSAIRTVMEEKRFRGHPL
ncbi:MAG TPA: hypothetical protein VFV34_19175, partial [Blastocatellia bacterium]|nr:hypothetical protein [Blastocatellia bacterium]